MSEYSFLTTWLLEAPIDRVWEAIHDSERWPDWWKGVKRVQELEPGDDEGRGSLTRYTWRSRLPYDLEFDMRVTARRAPVLHRGSRLRRAGRRGPVAALRGQRDHGGDL